MKEAFKKGYRKGRRSHRVRAKLKGVSSRPRLSVFRSDKHISAQIIDDSKGQTLVAVSDKEVKTPASSKDMSARVALAKAVGELLAKKSLEKKVTEVVFDRGSFKYHGRVKALAEGARSGGLKF